MGELKPWISCDPPQTLGIIGFLNNVLYQMHFYISLGSVQILLAIIIEHMCVSNYANISYFYI